MQVLVIVGACLAMVGIALLILCMMKARRLKQTGAEQAEAELRKLITLNMAGVGLGFFGLAIVLAGLFLG